MKLNKIFEFVLTWVVIPLILLGVWFGFSLFFTSKYSFSVIAIPHERDNFISFKNTELLAKEKVAAEFQAKENNLGIVSVRFYNFQRISNDVVIFRIKEKKEKKWFYENSYKVDQFQSDSLFTFGFPIIPDAKGKTYYFEIESIQGKRGDAIGLSEVYPPFVTQYQYPKEVLLSDKKVFLDFFTKKMFYSLVDRNFLISSLVYLLPFIFYVVWGYSSRVVIGIRFSPTPQFYMHSQKIVPDSVKNGYILVHLYLLLLLLSVLLNEEKNTYVTVLLIGLWIWLIRLYRFNSSVSYVISLFFLMLSPVFLLLNMDSMAERSALWVYFFLVIGTLFALYEVKTQDKRQVNYDVFLRHNYANIRKYFKKK